MKKTVLFLSFLFISNFAFASKLTLYFSPTCPHCHHAMEYIDGTLAKKYKDLKIEKIDLSDKKNIDLFKKVLEKCKYTSGGVPVMTINGKCFQGYAEFMNKDIIKALSEKEVQKEESKEIEGLSVSEDVVRQEGGIILKKSNIFYISIALILSILASFYMFKRNKK